MAGRSAVFTDDFESRIRQAELLRQIPGGRVVRVFYIAGGLAVSPSQAIHRFRKLSTSLAENLMHCFCCLAELRHPGRVVLFHRGSYLSGPTHRVELLHPQNTFLFLLISCLHFLFLLSIYPIAVNLRWN